MATVQWQTPKTDWYGATNSETGEYTGDRFNAVDYNRIKNNIIYLKELASDELYPPFDLVTVSNDKTYSDYPYADEINKIEDNFVTLNEHTVNLQIYGEPPPDYLPNAPILDYHELNRLESALLDIYDKLTNQIDGRRKFTWNFGMKGGDFN